MSARRTPPQRHAALSFMAGVAHRAGRSDVVEVFLVELLSILELQHAATIDGPLSGAWS